MNYIERFNKRMNYSGKTLREERIRDSKNLLSEMFKDDASHTPNIYLWTLGKDSYDSTDIFTIRLFNRKKSNSDGITVEFQSLDKLNMGNIIYDKDNDMYWLCIESFDIDGIHYQGKLMFCNWKLKWQNKEGIILEYPCPTINNSLNIDGEKFSKNLTIGSSRTSIFLPCDENTIILDSPKRFYLDKNSFNPTSYVLTQNDTISYNYGDIGLVKLIVSESEEDSNTDRPDLGICDYIDINNSNLTIDTTSSVYSKILYDTLVIKSGGNSQIFVGKFYDSNNNEILNIIPKWDVICDFKNVLNINKNNNQITLSIDDDRYVDEDIKLIFSDENNNYSSTLIINVRSLL